MNEIQSYASERGWGRSRLELKAHSVEEDLREVGVLVRDAPDYDIHTTLDETELEEVLQSVVGYARPETRTYDLKSLAAVWRIRDGRSQRHLENARAIFLTNNRRLVRASTKFFDESPNGFEVPISTLDSHLATVAWLKRPMAAPNLPRSQIVADCIAILEPGTQLWDRFLDVIDDLNQDGGISEEDYAILRYTVSARRALMETTLGDESAVTVGSVPEVLRRAKEAMTREAQDRLRAETRGREEAERRASLEAGRASDAEQRLAREKKEREEEVKATTSKHRSDLLKRVGNKAHRRAVKVARISYVFIFVVVVGSLLASLGVIAGAAAFILILALALLNARHLIFGGSLSQFVSRFERFLEQKIEEREQRSLGL